MKKIFALSLILAFLHFPILASEETVIYLVRHAEKVQDGTKDPTLSEQGVARSKKLAELLKDKNIRVIYSTDFKRTRLTAKPLADRLGIEIKLYDYKKLSELANTLKNSKQNILVVGHSNTTPELVELISGKVVEPIKEIEYSKLFTIKLLVEDYIVGTDMY
ncbi:MAG: histidine phosphatase family protein [Gammaproteobacteria bacterium]|nr:histidine phosphatase family protein [Gammaproteobacteria bacterium]MDH5630181.1 histidine phosphatase family protein [Gammaproteobacteria bacterium]